MAAVDTTATSTPRSPLTDILSSYAILPTLATWLSTLDLYHLALTNRSNFSSILESRKIFKSLSRHCLCDGRGLVRRQEFRKPYSIGPRDYAWGRRRKIYKDEPIEVRLYNVKCDEAGALPCIKCGINLCEECRSYPREPLERPKRRPHLDAAYQLSHIMCLCELCDAAAEKEVTGKFLNELCDCDIFERWICTRCESKEVKFMIEYFPKHTKMDPDDDTLLPSKLIPDHQFDRCFWCICGAQVPQSTRARCTWCKRRHLPESEWSKEWDEVGSKMPWVDDDPDYPHWVTDELGKYPNPYPELGHRRN
ncbi:hypothetical protein AUP68_11528 [Ilyonectria robusta]